MVHGLESLEASSASFIAMTLYKIFFQTLSLSHPAKKKNPTMLFRIKQLNSFNVIFKLYRKKKEQNVYRCIWEV